MSSIESTCTKRIGKLVLRRGEGESVVTLAVVRRRRTEGRKEGRFERGGKEASKASGGRRWRAAGAWLPRVASSLRWTSRGRHSRLECASKFPRNDFRNRLCESHFACFARKIQLARVNSQRGRERSREINLSANRLN